MSRVRSWKGILQPWAPAASAPVPGALRTAVEGETALGDGWVATSPSVGLTIKNLGLDYKLYHRGTKSSCHLNGVLKDA